MNNRLLSVMTWNIYFGASLLPLFNSTQSQIPFRVTEVFRQFLATNFPMRAKAIAQVIYINNPDIIGLQEAAIWKLIPQNSKVVEYDFIEILLHELEKLGLCYKAVAINNNFSGTLPSSTINLVSLQDRDVILVRKSSKIQIIDKQEANFVNNSAVSIGGQQITILQGWSYIDAYFKGIKFRLLNTHLDAASEDIRLKQVNELITGPGNTSLPLIFIGDFNSDANNNGITYEQLILAGFEDAWNIAGIGEGFTCCQDSDVLNSFSTLNTRIDLIVFKNFEYIDVEMIEVVGDKQEDRTRTRLWPSDHASVVAKFDINCHCNK